MTGNAPNTFFHKLRSCEMIVFIAKQSQNGHVIIFSEYTKKYHVTLFFCFDIAKLLVLNKLQSLKKSCKSAKK